MGMCMGIHGPMDARGIGGRVVGGCELPAWYESWEPTSDLLQDEYMSLTAELFLQSLSKYLKDS